MLLLYSKDLDFIFFLNFNAALPLHINILNNIFINNQQKNLIFFQKRPFIKKKIKEKHSETEKCNENIHN